MRLGLYKHRPSVGLSLLSRRATGAGEPFDIESIFALGEVGAWYDPNDLTTVWQDTAGTIPAVADDPVGRIDDKSGNGLNLTQGTAAARPTLRVDASGKYYLERDGVDDYMETTDTLSAEATWTLAYAGQYAAGAGSGTSAYVSISLNTTNYILIGFRQDVESARCSCRAANTSDALKTANGSNGLLPSATNRVAFGYLSGTEVATCSGEEPYKTTALDTPPLGPVASCRLRLGTQGGAALTIATRCYGLIAIKRALTSLEKHGVFTYLTQNMGP